MYELATHLESINEATTMDAISFIPSQMGVVQSALKKLAQEKLDWDIEILEGEESHSVTIGTRLRVNVPIKDWAEFTSLFGRDIRLDKSINLRCGYCESVTSEPPKFNNALRRAFHNLFKVNKVQTFERIIGRWRAAFPQSRYTTGDIPAIRMETRKKDVGNLVRTLSKQHEGKEEAFLTKLKETKELGADPAFEKHPWFAGTKINTVYEGVSMVFEGSLGYDGSIAVSITIHDPEVVEAVSCGRGVCVGNVFCTNERNFPLITRIKRVIDEMCDDVDQAEKDKIAEAKQAEINLKLVRAERKLKRKQSVEAKNAPSN